MKRILRAIYKAVITNLVMTRHYSFKTYNFPGQPHDVCVHHRWVNRISGAVVGHKVTNEDGTPWVRSGGYCHK